MPSVETPVVLGYVALLAIIVVHIGLMRAAERRARTADRGLWGACRYFGQPAR